MTTVDVPIFKDLPNTTTPVDAAHLTAWGAAIKANADAAEAAEAGATAPTDAMVSDLMGSPSSDTRMALDALLAAMPGEAPGEAPLQLALAKLNAALHASGVTPARVVFTGDSFTSANNNLAPNRWVNLLVAAITRAYPSPVATERAVITSATATWGTLSTALGVHGYNAGISGTWSTNYITDTTRPLIAALNPAMVVHMIGVTDYRTGVTPTAYKANVLANITALKAAITTPHVHVLVRPYRPADAGDAHTFPWDEYGTAQAEIAAADPDNVIYIDLNPEWVLVGVPEGGDFYDLLGTDVLHLTDLGHGFMAELMRRALSIPRVGQAGMAYTPTLAGVTLGNGTLVARARRVGESMRVRLLLTLGSTSAVTSTIAVGLPVPQSAEVMGSGVPLGTCVLVDASVGAPNSRMIGLVASNDANSVFFIFDRRDTTVSGAAARENAPWAWAVGDTIGAEFEFEPAWTTSV